MKHKPIKDDAAMLAQAQALGLTPLIEHNPEDILVAARVAQNLQTSFVACEDLTTEIWPSMTVGE